MKLIFLDHDGVICLSNNWGGRIKKAKQFRKETRIYAKYSDPNYGLPVDARFDDFDKKAVEVLNSILEETGAEIVVSSDWKRWATVEEMGDYYEQQGIIKKPIAFTKNLGECEQPADFPWSTTFDLEQSRSLEILQYLREHPEITHWVAVDDLGMGINVTHETWGDIERDWGLSNFVWTPQESEGIKQTGKKEKIIKYLSDSL